MKIKKTKPPKDREFLGLVGENGHPEYWDFFWWATKKDGINCKACYVDRAFFCMPKIIGWVEVPDLEG